MIRETREEIVYFADPLLGNIKINYEDLVSIWNGILIAIEGNGRPLIEPGIRYYQAPAAPELERMNSFMEVDSIRTGDFNSLYF